MKNTALITGASSGIGAELARIHAGKGGDLVLVARRQDRLKSLRDELVKRHARDVVVIPQDLAEPDCANTLYEACRADKIRVDYLINNAGFGGYGLFHESDPEVQDSMMRVNVLAATNISRRFLPDMVDRGRGWVMNVASTAAFVPGPLQSVYYASKAFVVSQTVAMANELKGTGVSATALCPGPTETEFFEVAGVTDTLMHRMGTMSARNSARYGYGAMLKGKTVAIPGFRNKLVPLLARLVPVKVAAATARIVQRKTE